MIADVPSGEELAAIVAALDAMLRAGACPSTTPLRASAQDDTGASVWVLAMRRPDLEFDDLLALRDACSIRF